MSLEGLKADDFPKLTRNHLTTIFEEQPDSPEGANPNCPVCKGAGFVHPYRGGRILYYEIIPCSARGCMLDYVRGYQPTEVQRQTFESFIVVPGAEKAFKAAQALALGSANFAWLLIYGQPGNGKTHLCNAIVKEVRARNLDVRMILAADLFSMLREAIETKKADILLRQFKEIFFLAIDDYGVEYGSEWEAAKFDELMTSRYATARPTVLVTNKDLGELPDRIKSRFQDKVMARAVHNSAPDYRSKRK